MPWYSYLFFFLAALALLGGTYSQSRARNTAGVIYALIVSAVWAFFGLWTAGVILS